jgi:AcrR family transcriptional regulator
VSSSTPSRSTRDAILDAAARLLSERGAGVRLEDIAEEAGVSRQTVYVRFGSRTGLMIATVQHMDEQGTLHRLVQQVFEAPTPLDALDAVVTVHAEYHPMVYAVAKIFMARRYEDDAMRAAWEDRMAARRNLYHEVVEWLQRDGLLVSGWDVETATDILWSMTSWQLWEQLTVDRGWSKEEYLGHVRTLLRRALVASNEA